MSNAGARRRSTVSRARRYLVVGTLLSAVVAFGVFVAAWSWYAVGQRTDDLARQVSVLAKGQAAAGQLDATAAEATRDRLLRIEAGLIGAALLVTDSDGNVERSTAVTASPPVPLSRLGATGVEGARSARLTTGDGVPVLVVAAPIDGGHQLVAVQGLAEIGRAQRGILALAALALVVSSAVAYVTGGVFARRLTAPLVRLEAAADHVADGAFGTQVAEEGDAETASLAHSFNRMSTRVAEAYDAQKAFVGDISHEIRTPLTSIRGFSEALLDGVIAEPDQQRRALRVIHDEATRIGEMSQTLLALSQLDAGNVQLRCVPIDLEGLQGALSGRFAVAAADADVALTFEIDPAHVPLGDPDRLLQVASALVSNALAHAPAGGAVRVIDELNADGWSLIVEDSGPGVPEADRDRVFERFARLDASRASGSGGAGLGLSIAHRLVELMGGSIGVGTSELGGAAFSVVLPAAEAPREPVRST